MEDKPGERDLALAHLAQGRLGQGRLGASALQQSCHAAGLSPGGMPCGGLTRQQMAAVALDPLLSRIARFLRGLVAKRR